MSPPRVAFLGPEGTYTHEALLAAAGEAALEPIAAATIADSIGMIGEARAELAFAPFENSIEGSVRSTLDTIAFDAPWAAVVGEFDHPIRHALIARSRIELGEIRAVVSHQQANAQCARFVRTELPGAEVRSVTSTAEAVRMVKASTEPLAALGSKAAAETYGCVVLREGVEDEPDNVTRFVWVARAGEHRPAGGERPWKTSLAFAELGADHPGALVEALEAFSRRDVNLTRIESRPLRRGLGRYMFFVDLEGSIEDPDPAAAVEELRHKAESVRVLGSYPVGGASPLESS